MTTFPSICGRRNPGKRSSPDSGGRHNFLEKYLTPSIELGLVEMTQPNSPRSPTQKYRLTAKGKKLRQEVLKPKQRTIKSDV